ncbi:2TM domain-containing protein [Lacibacter luteus]|uniref:2TM domain-containing protein n=1 Tax=Lacibacter luteus TaxID=2508719 RepID=A0A4Q1CHY1_9BACT|nr:2TM domain-containing protein [Lacibacter luteus]RXK59968.1 2TM domain-containing protein [Lacibacter luteus]
MSNFQRISDANDDKDKKLWELAQKRVAFKRHLVTYVIVNAFLWAMWAINGPSNYHGRIPWPLWSTIGWGIGLAFHFAGAYITTGENSVEREYDKLKNKQ